MPLDQKSSTTQRPDARSRGASDDGWLAWLGPLAVGMTALGCGGGEPNASEVEAAEAGASSVDASASTGDEAPSTDGGDGDGDGDGDALCAGLFPADDIWCEDAQAKAKHPDSDTITAWLDQAGWGGGDEFRIDFSFELLEADASTPKRSFEATGDFFSPDCDYVEVPVPEGGQLEGEQGYECTSDGDCHLLVVNRDEQRLYEMWRANIVNDTFFGGCLAVWDLTQTYPTEGRGDGCTSADAAGFPIAPLLFTADEVASGDIGHAIRFILPNAHIRNLIYTRPATHSTGATSGPAQAPPYGVHMRLRADYDMSQLPNEGARTVARALQDYGMFLADGGQIALTGLSDRYTTAKWEGLLDPRDLVGIRPSDFEVVDWGPGIDWSTVSCEREPLGTPP